MTKILKCDYKHPGQDKLHGIGNRVHNETNKHQYRCTVCGKIKQ